MRYGIGTAFSEFGFNFLEKIHEPILLVHSGLGHIVKMNEAARKLMKVTHYTTVEIENFLAVWIKNIFANPEREFHRAQMGQSHHVIARNIKDSEYILVEIVKN